MKFSETKDILFFTYKGHQSCHLYELFKEKGWSVDIVDETNLHQFVPYCNYRIVSLHLHEYWTIPITNHFIDNFFSNSMLVQHDETDHEDVQLWSNKKPYLIMQREYTKDSKNQWGSPIEPFHFGWHSMYDPTITEKPYDVCFVANMTSPRRIPFVEHLCYLMTGPLKHLNWFVNVEPHANTPFSWYNVNIFGPKTQNFKEIINKSKIGLHYFGNSYDSVRIWELASAKTAIIMPHMRNKSVDDEHMPFKDYCVIRDDCSDLEEKIVYLLENDRYKDLARRAFDDYNNNHTIRNVFDYYYGKFCKYGLV